MRIAGFKLAFHYGVFADLHASRLIFEKYISPGTATDWKRNFRRRRL